MRFCIAVDGDATVEEEFAEEPRGVVGWVVDGEVFDVGRGVGRHLAEDANVA